MCGDMQDAGSNDALQRCFRSLFASEKLRVWKQLSERAYFLAYSGQGTEKDLRIIYSCRAICPGYTVAVRGLALSNQGRIAKRRVGQNQRRTLALARDFQPQEIAPDRQVRKGVMFDQEASLL